MTSGKDTVSYFNQIAESWQRLAAIDPAAVAAALDALRLSKGSRVLDAGCGTGLMLTPLLSRLGNPGGTDTYGRVVGLDPARRMLAVAARRIRDPRLRLVCTSLCDYDGVDGPFDAILCSRILHLMDDPPAVLTRLAGWLKPGGRLVILHVLDEEEVTNPVVVTLEHALSGDKWTRPACERGTHWAVLAATRFGLEGLD